MTRLLCALAIALAASDHATAQTTPPTQEDSQRIADQTDVFLGLFDQDDRAQIIATLAQSLKQADPGGTLFDRMFTMRADGVDFSALRPLNVTWYADPDTGTPGSFAAVDFSSTETAEHLACGFVVWRMERTGAKVVRMEASMVPRHVLATITADDLQQATRQMGCRIYIPPRLR